MCEGIEIMKKKTKNELLLELDGVVSLIEKKNGKVVLKEELDAEVVLDCVKHVLEVALKELPLFEKSLEKEKK